MAWPYKKNGRGPDYPYDMKLTPFGPVDGYLVPTVCFWCGRKVRPHFREEGFWKNLCRHPDCYFGRDMSKEESDEEFKELARKAFTNRKREESKTRKRKR